MLYEGSLFTGRGEFIERRTFGTLAALKSWAAPHLPTITTTAETRDRDLSRAPSVRVTAARGADLKLLDGKRCGSKKLPAGHWGKIEFRKRVRVFYLEPECIIVPSVGDRGYF